MYLIVVIDHKLAVGASRRLAVAQQPNLDAHQKRTGGRQGKASKMRRLLRLRSAASHGPWNKSIIFKASGF